MYVVKEDLRCWSAKRACGGGGGGGALLQIAGRHMTAQGWAAGFCGCKTLRDKVGMDRRTVTDLGWGRWMGWNRIVRAGQGR